ncbi:OLC1v1026911C1 [Oldenlandia corymbosa var. corymbosa]|uniref:OLC1v1026911C1 n=1 Tax=Oldenlandia corymbosa var. corymbosa TaxID=529605 RepID=A0AAV1C864_OLDCO|nr:OLC1v1026911C1 [Oldenlandia corymbosa var. corymbosa]
MESAAVLRSFNCMTSPLRSISDKPGVFLMNSASFSGFGKHTLQGLSYGAKLISSPNKLGGAIVLSAKSSEVTLTAKSNDLGDSNGAVKPDSSQKVSGQNSSPRRTTFPNGFEELVTDVCDDTEIVELKVKIGDFEMHMKRNVELPKAPAHVESPTVAPPIPSEPMNELAPVAAPPPAPPKPTEKVSPFTNIPAERSAKLAALEASGSSGYVLVSSPTVGSFRRGRTFKGKKQPPIVKEGDVIKEGQTIGYLDQFGTELPVKSDAAGEVLKFLYNDGEAVGYGDPLIAVLPSFHGIK